MPRTTWFCIDIECSGPVPHLYDMISLGAVRVVEAAPDETAAGPIIGSASAVRSPVRYEIGAPYYVEICPTAARVDLDAMKVNKLDLDRLRREGRPLGEALTDLTAWVTAQTLPGSKPSFVGHNAPFDWSFVAYGYHACGLRNPFGYKALDTKALAMGVLGLHWFDTHKERLQELLALPEHDLTQVHRADYDAWYQAHILVGLLRHMEGRT
jgi:DNA polymerase III epsilon subunit-like protein